MPNKFKLNTNAKQCKLHISYQTLRRIHCLGGTIFKVQNNKGGPLLQFFENFSFC